MKWGQVFGRSWREVAPAGVHPVTVCDPGPDLIEIPRLENECSVTQPPRMKFHPLRLHVELLCSAPLRII